MLNLFNPPDKILCQNLVKIKKAVSFAFPQKKAHLDDLPYAIRDLSRLLTTERGQKNAYWVAPRFLGAYLHYFLPWNLFRLAWLLPTLPLNLQAGDKILDLGSGPLTMPLALWLCRPQDRLLPLFWHCSDLAPHPMELGRSIFKNFITLDSAEQKIPEGWKLNLMRAPLELALRKINGRVNLITALNVLNELPTPRQDSLEERLDSLFASMDRALAVGGKILFIEPGTRFGGKIIQLMRLAALTRGYETLSPCMHDNSCPFLTTGEANLQRPERWCHFGHTTAGAPDELQKLSGMAGLSKDSVHLSFMLLHKGKSRVDSNFSGKHASVREKIMTGRVVSDSIRLPEHGNAYYVCTEDGLGILTGSRKMSSGSEVLTRLAKKGGKDLKTGAMFLELATCID